MPMTDLPQELMTPPEAARWFRRSQTWLRQQKELLRVSVPGGQPLYHVRVCRAWVLGRLRELEAAELRAVQLTALAAACGLPAEPSAQHQPRPRATPTAIDT
ncbi:MAG: hypothetical protein KKB50_09255 [Planctomycetes bacterium]|nr:hypothetical protein [Planctomycetota bacterium]